MVDKRDPLTYDIIGIAIAIHRERGPGLLESAYEDFLCSELTEKGIAFRRQVVVSALYKGRKVDIGIKRFVL